MSQLRAIPSGSISSTKPAIDEVRTEQDSGGAIWAMVIAELQEAASYGHEGAAEVLAAVRNRTAFEIADDVQRGLQHQVERGNADASSILEKFRSGKPQIAPRPATSPDADAVDVPL